MEFILFGLLLIFAARKMKKGTPSDPYLGSRYEPVHYSPEVYNLIQKHGINETRRISARYNGR